MSSIITVHFCTSNINKVNELHKLLPTDLFDMHHESIDLIEIQGDIKEISMHKCKAAYKIVQNNVLVEDTSLSFNALQGLPGPYVKHFLSKIGPEGLYKLLDGFEDKSAYASCVFSYFDGKLPEPLTFEGTIYGKIVEPRGFQGFGWDCIFKPDGYNQTFGELDKDIKNTISHRYMACKLFVNHFSKKNLEIAS